MAFDITSILGSNIGEAISKIIGTFKVDPTLAMQKQAEIDEIKLQLIGQLQGQIGQQIDVDKQEAANANIFVAGWRPFIGWICGVGLACQFIVGPIFTWIAALAHHPTPFPTLDLGTLMTLLLGMLGLGGMRTYEKTQGAVGADRLK